MSLFNSEFLQKTIKDNLDLELENDTSFRETRTRDAQADTVPQKEELRPQIPRRKKKKKSKKQHESLSAETTTAGPEFSVQVDTAEGGYHSTQKKIQDLCNPFMLGVTLKGSWKIV